MTKSETESLVTKAIKPIAPKKPYLPPNLRPDLTGRQVYFTMGAKQFKVEDTIYNLTPDTLYTVIRERSTATAVKTVWIANDIGHEITILLGDTCAHLDFLAKWKLKREKTVCPATATLETK